MNARRTAVVLPSALLLAGLVAGGAAGWRSVTGRTVRVPGPPPAPRLAVRGVEGPIGQLGGLGEVAWVDDDGGVHAVTPDGRAQRTLGRATGLSADPSTSPGFDGGPGLALASPDGAVAYGYTDDGGPVAVRLADAQARRLSPPGTVAAAPIRQSADGTVVAVCARKRGGDQGRDAGQATTWLLDREGRQLASFPGCTLDLARDGGSALVPDPAGGDGASGLRLWRRSGGYRHVLGAGAVLDAARSVAVDARQGDFAIADARLAPDGRRALVTVAPRREQAPDLVWWPGGALMLVDLPSGRWRLVPAEVPGAYPVAWGPAGGFAYGQTSGANHPTVAYAPPGAPPVLLEAGHQHSSLRLAFSPDGDWLLVPDTGQWTFIRVDDPSTRVTYLAPGDFAGWLPGRGPR